MRKKNNTYFVFCCSFKIFIVYIFIYRYVCVCVNKLSQTKKGERDNFNDFKIRKNRENHFKEVKLL